MPKEIKKRDPLPPTLPTDAQIFIEVAKAMERVAGEVVQDEQRNPSSEKPSEEPKTS